MKTLVFSLITLLSLAALSSCESTNSRRAGGGAFDDSETGRRLDGNGILPDPENPAGQSFDQWREQD